LSNSNGLGQKNNQTTFMHLDKDVNHPRDFDAICEMIVKESQQSPIFIKDMAYYFESSDLLLSSFAPILKNATFTFLIRDPASAIVSHHKMNSSVTFRELGYEKLLQVSAYINSFKRKNNGKLATLIQSEDLLLNPEETMKKWCIDNGLEFKNSLQWEQEKEIQIWESWKEWHATAIKSGGIIVKTREELLKEKIESLDYIKKHNLVEVYENCQRIYNVLISLHSSASSHEHSSFGQLSSVVCKPDHSRPKQESHTDSNRHPNNN
jgi:hypothetical protein